jgi:hypothetical protein
MGAFHLYLKDKYLETGTIFVLKNYRGANLDYFSCCKSQGTIE